MEGSFVQSVAADGTVSCGVGVRLLASSAFNGVSVPAAGSSAAILATLSFTPARSGTVRLVSHGHCLQGQLNTDSEIGIAAGTSESDAFAVSAARIGVLKLPGSVSPSGNSREPGCRSASTPSMRGAFTTVRLYGRHAVGFEADACSGWFKVEGRSSSRGDASADARRHRLFGDRTRKTCANSLRR